MSFALGSINGEYEPVESLPEPRCYATPCILKDEVYIIGGCDKIGTPIRLVKIVSNSDLTYNATIAMFFHQNSIFDKKINQFWQKVYYTKCFAISD